MQKKRTRFLSLLLALMMVVSMLPLSAVAADEGTNAGLVTNVADIAAGDRVVIVASQQDYALSTTQKTNNRGAAVITKADSTITLTSDVQVLTLEDGTADGTFAFNTGDGYLYAAGTSKAQNGDKNQNYLRTETALSANSSWKIEISDGIASIVAQGDNGCNIMQYNVNSTLFAAYSTASQASVSIYKLGASSGDDAGNGEAAPGPAEPVIVPVSTALAGESGAEFTVKGVVTLVDSSNIYIQDNTGAICVRMAQKPTDISLGDTIIGTGVRADYYGLPQLGSSTYEKSEGLTLSARETTIGALTAADICGYVKLSGLEVTEVSGTSVTLTDGTDTIQIYKAVMGDTALKTGDVIDIKAAVGYFNAYQLRNTLASEITVVKSGGEEESEAPAIADGKYIIWAPAYNMALSSTYAEGSFYNSGVEVSEENGVLSGYGESEIWTVANNEDGTISISYGGENLALAAKYSSMTLGEVNDKWLVEDAGNGLFYIKNTVRGNYIEWYADKGNWSSYYKISSGSEGLFALQFTKAPQYAKLDNEIEDGDELIIFYNKDSLVVADEADGTKLKGVSATPEGDFILVEDAMAVLTAAVDGNGYYTFKNADGLYLTSGKTGNSLSFTEAASDYSLWTIKTVDGGVHIVNVNASYNGKSQALEYYKGFTTYSEKDNDYYLFNLYVLTDEAPAKEGLAEGAKIVIYNLSAEGVLAAQNDSNSIESSAADIIDDKAVPENGAALFTVSKNGDYWRFYNETYGYLCSNGTGNNAFYSKEASDDADWTVTDGKSGGYFLESRTAKFNGKYSQYLEYYADAFKTYSMYNVTNYDIYEFFFYPINTDWLDESFISDGIVNKPAIILDYAQPIKGNDWVVSFTVDAVFGIKDTIDVDIYNDVYGDGTETVLIENAASLRGPDGEGKYYVTVPASVIAECGAGICLDITLEDAKGNIFGEYYAAGIIDEPSIGDVSPAANSETGDEKKPTISAAIINAGEDAVVTMLVAGEEVDAVYADGVVSYTPAVDLAEGRTVVTVKVVRADGKEAEKSWSFNVGEAQYALYFGQLHSHTTYSDGSGSLTDALNYIKNLPANANVDFVAFTDHSNYFDGSSAGTTANPEGALYDMSLASEVSQSIWNEYVGTIDAFNEANADIIAIPGFEMTWSGGPGHINTFNTEGIVSRNNTTLNNKTADAGMKAYYELLSQSEGADSINQFNHPGTTFGNFTDFAYWDALVDTRIQLVEVGNGEGAIGAGGYYPSYEEYTLALDKGWHVAPTNNQDNHKGKWGNANDARDVILTDNFTEEGIYDAIRNYRVYATEDKNLEIYYTMNDLVMGSIIEEVPEMLNISVSVYDPDSSDSISKVEVIVNSGKTAYVWDTASELASGVLAAELEPTYSYYYIRVTQGDGDIAVTAPVWVGETLKLGTSSVETATTTPVTGEELTISTGFFNSESSDAFIKHLTYTIGGEVIGTDSTGYTIPASGTASVDFNYTPDAAKLTTITVTAIVEQEGVEYTFSMDIELDVQDADKLVYIGIDASHFNEYVNGNYKDNMGNFTQLAAEYNVRTVTLYESADLIAACGNDKYVALILTAPSRRSPEAQSADPLKTYSAEEISAIKAFNDNGGTVILAGWSDHYENYPDVAAIANMKAEEHMAATQNAVLEALGSSLRIGDDATYDDDFNGGQAYRLYFNAYNYDSFLVDGVEVDSEHLHDRLYTEVYSHYGGASVYTVDGTLGSGVIPVVFGHAGTYSVDVDKDGLGGDAMYKYAYAEGDERLVTLATEQLEGKGLIIVSGAAFMSNFEVQATIEDSGSEKNYSNYKICENLLAYLNPVSVTDIAEVQKQTEVGYKYTIEGVVSSNASGYDKDTAFFDCIYVQDETGGICCFPVAGNYKIGDMVRVTGTTEFYQGEMELQVSEIEIIGSGSVEAKKVSAEDINNGSVIGQLVSVSGTVTGFERANGLVQTIYVRDFAGDTVRVFIDGYITTDADVEGLAFGKLINVTGLASYDNTFNAPEGPFPRIRIRDRADIECFTVNIGTGDETPGEEKVFPFTDVVDGAWYYGDVYKLWKNEIMNGVSDTLFAPASELNRAMFATMIYRLSGEVYEGDGSAFADVADGNWYSDAIAWCVEKGIVTGFSETEFAPDRALTREQAVTMLYRYAQYKGYDVSAGESTELSFNDSDEISAYAVDAMKWAVGNGIIRGVENNNLAPTATSTRAQIACIFSRLIDWVK